MKSVCFLLKSNQLRIRQLILVYLFFVVINATTSALLKQAMGLKKLSQNASLLMCFSSFATEQSLTL